MTYIQYISLPHSCRKRKTLSIKHTAVISINYNTLHMNARFDVTEHSSFVECVAVSLDYWFLTCQRIALPSSSRAISHLALLAVEG